MYLSAVTAKGVPDNELEKLGRKMRPRVREPEDLWDRDSEGESLGVHAPVKSTEKAPRRR